MPYRIDLHNPPDDVLDRLLELGALDVDAVRDGLAAIIPDSVAVSAVTRALGVDVRVTPVRGRDDDSVWVVGPRPTRAAGLQILPADWPPEPGALRIIDGPAFGTGLHATTALCLDVLQAELRASTPVSVLDVGTGSGILALAALCAGVPRAVAIDISSDALQAAAENARLNRLTSRIALVRGGPESLSGAWPLVLANVLAAPLIEMAPMLVRRVGHSGRLVLSGIRSAISGDVESAYRRLGLKPIGVQTKDGWAVLTLSAPW